ncbi:hypothetical protein Trydic_g2242 [Trypoxylus dichotomus]
MFFIIFSSLRHNDAFSEPNVLLLLPFDLNSHRNESNSGPIITSDATTKLRHQSARALIRQNKNAYSDLLQMSPTNIFASFESGMITAFAEEFPASEDRGKHQSESLKDQYEIDAEFILKLKLALVPTTNLVETLCEGNMLIYI